jgi:hypothetical protein
MPREGDTTLREMVFGNYSLVLVVLLLGVCILVYEEFSKPESFQTIQIHDVDYYGISDTSKRDPLVASGPVSVKKIKDYLGLNKLDISFEFSSQDSTFSYGNLFQTGDSINALRMELQPSSNLVIVLGMGVLYPLSKTIQVDKYYDVQLQFEKNKFFKIFVDDVEVLNITDKNFLSGKFDISNIVVGTGLAEQRSLLGTVKNFNIICTYSYYSRVVKLTRWILIFICGILLLMSLPKKSMLA